jgi:hypothetical protein
MSEHLGSTHCALAAVTALAAAAAGCASTTVRTDSDPRVNLAQYDTFALRRGQVLVNGVADNRDTLVRDRVESALGQELQQKGLEPSAQNPDLIATYTAGARSVAEFEDDWDGVVYGGPRGAWVDEYTRGTLLIDLIDPKTNKLVWRAIVDMGEDEDLRSAENIRKAVDKAFEKYPGPFGASSS